MRSSSKNDSIKMKISTRPVLSAVFFMMLCFSLIAQQKKAAAPEKNNKRKAYLPIVTLGKPGFAGGQIKAANFDSLLKQGIYSHDSAGNPLNVVSFNFSYLERMIYEDSVGDLHQVTDISKEFCKGNTVTENIAGSIYERIKSGDTVRIDEVLLTKNKPGRKIDTFLGKSIKCIIIK
jgi:hypothetical protein